MEVNHSLESTFSEAFLIIVNDLTEHAEHFDIPESVNWLVQVVRYNVPHGKKTRGMAVAKAYSQFCPDQNHKDLTLACILGWCVEILQASFLVADDIMDHSELRRGRPCWYRVNGVGDTAINDSFMLENCLYYILKKHFSTESYYVDLIELFHSVTLKTTFGQTLDMKTSSALTSDLSAMTIERYKAIVKYKTSYYSFCLPVFLAFSLCGIPSGQFREQAENILLKMGYIFQAQDDILDCFGDSDTTGKTGKDIADGKCTWPLVKALTKASPAQKKILFDCYGVEDDEKVKTVQQLYTDLNILSDFKIYEEKCYRQITKLIDDLKSTEQYKFFSAYLLDIYRRQK